MTSIGYTPPPSIFAPPHVGPTSPWSAGHAFLLGTATPASGAHPTAAMAFFYPISVPIPYLVKRVYWVNGATLAGTVDVGLFSESGVRILSCGATSPTPVNAIQFADVADTMLSPGAYYLALSASLATTTFWRHTMQGAAQAQLLGALQMASAHALPATATFAAMGSSYLPYFGITNT